MSIRARDRARGVPSFSQAIGEIETIDPVANCAIPMTMAAQRICIRSELEESGACPERRREIPVEEGSPSSN